MKITLRNQNLIDVLILRAQDQTKDLTEVVEELTIKGLEAERKNRRTKE